MRPPARTSIAALYCVPSEKTLESFEIDGAPASPTVFDGPPASSKICYKAKCPKVVIADFAAFDQFGSRTLEKPQTKMICAPAEIGVPSRRVFLTLATTNGNLGGLAGADATCQDAADGAGLGGTYKAWLSDATQNPANRFTHSAVPYVLVTGTQIAADWNDLVDGTLDAPIDRDQSGSSVGFDPKAFTATAIDGTRSASNITCLDWTDSTNSNFGQAGSANQIGSSWTAGPSFACNSPMRLYCFEQ